MGMTAAQLVVHLNAIDVGEMGGIQGKLEEARQACFEMDLADLAEKLVEAQSALEQADMRTYRKRVATVIAKLGHLR